MNIGLCLQADGRFRKAWNTFSMAIAIEPACVEALEGRALVCLEMKNAFAAHIDISAALVTIF